MKPRTACSKIYLARAETKMCDLAATRDSVIMSLNLLQGFGQADHKVTCSILSSHYGYPDGNITWSNSGY